MPLIVHTHSQITTKRSFKKAKLGRAMAPDYCMTDVSSEMVDVRGHVAMHILLTMFARAKTVAAKAIGLNCVVTSKMVNWRP